MMGRLCIDSREACSVYYAAWHSALHSTAIMNAATIVTWEVCSFIWAHVGSRC